METRGITLDELYGFLQRKFEEIDKRFEYLEAKIDGLEKRMSSLENRMESLERRMDSVERRLENVERLTYEIYEKRDKISLQFNRKVILGNSILSGIIAFIVSMFTGKYYASW